MNGKARDGQEMTKVRKQTCWQIAMAPFLLFFPGGSVFCFLSERQSQSRLFQSEDFSTFHLREWRACCIICSVLWACHGLPTETPHQKVMRGSSSEPSVSLLPSIPPILSLSLSAPPPLLSNTYTPQLFLYLLRAQELVSKKKIKPCKSSFWAIWRGK